MNKKYIIYKVTNLVNNKVYIGQTTKTLEQRKLGHEASALRRDGFYFQRALLKYGFNNFKWEILGEVSNKEELDDAEKICIEFFNSRNFLYGYNLHEGGTGGNVVSDYNRESFCKRVSNGLASRTEEQIQQQVEKRKQTYLSNNSLEKQIKSREITLSNNPEIQIQSEKKRQKTINENYDDFYKEVHKKRLETEENDPSIRKKRSKSYKKTLKENPDIQKKRVKKFLKTLKEDPSIVKKQQEHRLMTLKNNPDIQKNAIKKRLETEKNNPEIREKRIAKYKETLKNNPEICRKRSEKYKLDCEVRDIIIKEVYNILKVYSINVFNYIEINIPSNSSGSLKWLTFYANLHTFFPKINERLRG